MSSTCVSGIRTVPAKIGHFCAAVYHGAIATPGYLGGRVVKAVSSCVHGVSYGVKATAFGINFVVQSIFIRLLSWTGCDVKKLRASVTSAESQVSELRDQLNGIIKERDTLNTKLGEIKDGIEKNTKRADLLKLFPQPQPQPQV